MVGLPETQTRFVSVDAVNHVTEAATSSITSPFSVLTAKETVKLVHVTTAKPPRQVAEDPSKVEKVTPKLELGIDRK